MSKISALDFANNVERNRKKLIQHCLKHGKEVSEGESLDVIVATNDEISTSTPDGYFKVEFKDLNGDYFAPTQYVQAGGSAVIPDGYPELEPDILEFVEWTCSGDLNNVQDNLVCFPQYQTKINEVANQRPSIFKCYFYEARLSPSINFGNATKTYIDWGDNSEITQAVAGGNSHTYTKEGAYTIVVYGERYSFKGTSKQGFFTEAGYSTCLYKAYMGENCIGLPNSYIFNNNNALTTIVLSPPEETYSSIASSVFSDCTSLKHIVIPNGYTRIGSDVFLRCRGLKSIVIANTIDSIGQYAFKSCSSLDKIIIPNGVSEVVINAFDECSVREMTVSSSVKKYGSSSGVYALSIFNIYQDWDINFPSANCVLEENSLIDVANKLKDNSDSTTKTVYLNYGNRTMARLIYLDQFGKRVPYGTEGAVSLLEFIQNKNWTVSFSG